MSTITVRPSSTVDNIGVTFNGASLHATLSDDSDATFATVSVDDVAMIEFAAPSIPAGALVRSVALRARVAQSAGSAIVAWGLDDGVTPSPSTYQYVTWAAQTTVTVLSQDADSMAAPQVLVNIPFATGNALIAELYVDVLAVLKPTVTVDAPADGSTITDTNLPTISWTATLDPDGGAQTGYAVRVYTRAQTEAPGFTPGRSPAVAANREPSDWTAGTATSWQPPSTLADGDYVVYVAVTQSVNGANNGQGLWSDPVSFTIDVAPPGEPTVTVTPESDQGRVRIDVVCDTTGGVPSTDFVIVHRTLDYGPTSPWESIRSAGVWPPSSDPAANLVPVDGLVTVYDFEAPNGSDLDTRYRALALHDYSGEYAQRSSFAISGTWSSDDVWLKNPLDPSLSMRVTMQSFPTRTRSSRVGVVQALGASGVSASFDTRGPETGTLVLQVQPEDHEALDALLDAQVPLLLVAPSTWPVPFPFYFVVTGDVQRTNPADKAFLTWTLDTLTWTRVDSPPGGLLTVPA